MNFIDILIVAPLVFAAWSGFRKGFVIEIFTLFALIIGIYAGIHFSDWTSNIIQPKIKGKYLPVIAFTLTFLVVGAMVFFAGKMIEKVIKTVNLNIVNKLLGLTLGLTKMVFVLSILVIIIETYDERGGFVPQKIKAESALYYPVKSVAITVFPTLEKSTIWAKNNINSVISEK